MTYYTDFTGYPLDVRPADMRRHRTSTNPLWDQIVRADAAFSGGRKLSFEATGGASRVLTFDYVPVTDFQEIIVCMTAGGSPGSGGTGGCVVGSTTYWNDVAGERRFGEHGARLGQSGTGEWRFERWRYNDSPNLQTNMVTASIDAWFAPGTKVRIRLRRDPNDTDGGANPLGTVRGWIWPDADGTDDSAAIELAYPLTEGTPPGPLGLYGNEAGGLAQYDWVGISTTTGVPAPQLEDGHIVHAPQPIDDAPDLAAYVVLDDSAGLPAELVPYGDAGTAWSTADQVLAEDGRVVRGVRSGGTFRNFLRYAMGNPDHEIIARMRAPTTGNYRGGVGVRMGTDSGSVDTAGAGARDDGDVSRWFWTDGAVSVNEHAMRATGITRSNWHWVRLQARGNIIRAKLWQDELQPTFWGYEFSDPDYAGNEGVGLLSIDTNTVEFDVVAVRVADTVEPADAQVVAAQRIDMQAAVASASLMPGIAAGVLDAERVEATAIIGATDIVAGIALPGNSLAPGRIQTAVGVRAALLMPGAATVAAEEVHATLVVHAPWIPGSGTNARPENRVHSGGNTRIVRSYPYMGDTMLTKRRDERELMTVSFDLDEGDEIAEVLELRILLDGHAVPELRADEPDPIVDGSAVHFWLAAGSVSGLHRIGLRVRTAAGRILVAKGSDRRLYPLVID